MKILVTLCTLDRDDLLETCLRELSRIEVPAGADVGVCVVVNKASGFESTQAVVSAIAASSPFPVWLVNEPRPGIPYARNRGLDEALKGGWTHIAFIDDDGYPERRWLAELVSSSSEKHCAASGPQVPVFPDYADRDLVDTGIYSERILEKGSETPWAATNNVLASLDDIRACGVRFEEALAMSGSSDKLFFLLLARRTSKPVVWNPDAVVFEPVPPSRLSVSWMRRRAYRYGATGFQVRRRVHGTPAALAFCVVRGLHLIAVGSAQLLLKPGRAGRLKALCSASHGIGFIAGIIERFRVKKYV